MNHTTPLHIFLVSSIAAQVAALHAADIKPAPLKVEMPACMKTDDAVMATQSGGAFTWEGSR